MLLGTVAHLWIFYVTWIPELLVSLQGIVPSGTLRAIEHDINRIIVRLTGIILLLLAVNGMLIMALRKAVRVR